MVGGNKEPTIDVEFKKCTQLEVIPFPQELSFYNVHLQHTLNHYIKKYEWADHVNAYKVMENMSIHHYKPGEGFYQWHTENTGEIQVRNRHLVFMTYLNTLDNAGTEFYYQKTNTPCEKGLPIIWPAAWTHTHRGVTNHSLINIS